MAYINKIQVLGRLGQDPEKKVTQSGASVVTLSVATTETWKDKEGNKQELTEWHRAIFWNKQADIIEQYFKKGSQIYIEGSLATREWEDKDGNKRWTTEIKGREFQFVDKLDSQQGQGGNQGSGQTQAPNGGEFIEDDIPF